MWSSAQRQPDKCQAQGVLGMQAVIASEILRIVPRELVALVCPIRSVENKPKIKVVSDAYLGSDSWVSL